MPQVLKTEAIILRRRTLLEQDVMLTIFSKEEGKLTIMAKGIKKLTSRRAAHVQTGNLVNLVLQSRHDRWYLQQSDLISGFSAIKDDFRKTNILYMFFFLLDRTLPEGSTETQVYAITKKFLVDLSRRTDDATKILTEYMQEVMMALGYVSEPKSLGELVRLLEEIIHEKIPFRII